MNTGIQGFRDMGYRDIKSYCKRWSNVIWDANIGKDWKSESNVGAVWEDMNETQQRIEYLQGVKETGRTTMSIYNQMSEIEVVIKEEIRDFIESAPKYNGENILMERKFGKSSDWLYMGNNPNKDVKQILGSRREIVLFFPTGSAFERCETGVFF